VTRALPRSLVAAACCALPAAALADPPPKVCVAVAGDPDEAVRTLARETEARLASSSNWRTVADATTRDALRGESTTPTDQADRAVSRRALRATDADASTLDSLGDALGCGWFITLSSRAAGTAPRFYDLGRHAFAAAPAAGSFDAAAVVLLLEDAVTHQAASLSSPSANVAASSARSTPARAAPNISRVWPWLVVGGVLLGVVGALVLLQGDSAPRTTITVVHRGVE
jgi:hypothetical protein